MICGDRRFARLLAGKGDRHPAARPANDNPLPATAPVATPDEVPPHGAIGPASASPSSGLASAAMVSAAIALAGGRDAAVTVRLDPSRHLQLRLACATGGRSAQAIIGTALDAYFSTIPAIGQLLARTMAEGGDHAAAGRGNDG